MVFSAWRMHMAHGVCRVPRAACREPHVARPPARMPARPHLIARLNYANTALDTWDKQLRDGRPLLCPMTSRTSRAYAVRKHMLRGRGRRLIAVAPQGARARPHARWAMVA